MKTKITVLAIMAAGAMWQGHALADSSNLSTAGNATGIKIEKSDVQTTKHSFFSFFEWLHFGKGRKDQIVRYENISSQPWTQAVGWHQGAPSWAYEDAIIHEPQLGVTLASFR